MKTLLGLVIALLFFVVPDYIIAAIKSEQAANTFHIILPKEASPGLKRIAGIMQRQISQRCSARAVSHDPTSVQIELSIRPGLGNEAYRIGDGKNKVIQIYGNDERGILYGVGKFLRTSRFDQGGFSPGQWRGASQPQCPLRAVYLATHFNNFYEAAPLQELVHYIQDIGLWGYNTVLIHYPTWQYKNFADKNSGRWLERFKTVLKEAKACGLQVGLIQVPNDGFNPAPPELSRTKVPGHRRGNFGQCVCTSKPEARERAVQIYTHLLKEFKEIGLDFFEFWPYDEGGCACDDCRPWGARGFLSIAKTITPFVHAQYPQCKIILSTWCFENEDDLNPDGEWAGLAESMAKDKSWVDYIMADGHDDYFPSFLLEKGTPGDLPLLNFPEISMFGMSPWGGYGANPAPAHFQMLWDRIKHQAAGGAPYSEGLYEDINKAIIAGFYWNPDQKAEDTVKEYIAFEFSPETVDRMLELIRILERNHHRKRINDDAGRAFDLAENLQSELTEQARKSWRWRIIYLRALIDKEMQQRAGKLEGDILKKAFAELTQIYHAENAHSMPIKPPQVD